MSLNNLKSEIVYLIRNSDVFTIAQRNVTTTTTGAIALSGASSYILNVTNIKNIRSLTIDTVSLKYGKDYTLDLDHLDGTIKCKIDFTTPQTGDMVIQYDAGSDKIFTDFPRGDLTINSYPRIAIEEISKNSEAFSLGGSDFISNIMFTIVVYAENQEFIEQVLSLIESTMKTNAKNFYYIPFIKPTGRGPIMRSEDRSQTLMHKNTDFIGMFEVT